jgi:probable LLM family oxidoreductase
MQIGVDSFAAAMGDTSAAGSPTERLRDLLEEIEHADQVGLDVFGVGEHHRKEFLDSAPTVILGAAAGRTKNIRLTSAVTVLSAADPVRIFQQFATLDLVSQGRAEMIVGRGSFIEAFPLFGYKLEDYDSLFADKLDLLLEIRDNEFVHWSGKHRPPLTGQGVYPRPLQDPLPIWLGVGGTPGSFARAGALGLPLMVAIIGGQTRSFRPLVDLYREAGRLAGFGPDRLKVGVHALGYAALSKKEAADDFFPGYLRAFSSIGKERGWSPPTRAQFDAQLTPDGALLVGEPDEIVEKVIRHSEALGGITRITFMMNAATLPHRRLMSAIDLLGTRIAPALREEFATSAPSSAEDAQVTSAPTA